MPRIYPSAFVHPQASIIGDVEIGPEVFVAPFASIRADAGTPFFLGARSNVQDGVVLHAEMGTVDVGGKRYAIYIGERVSLSQQSQVRGPSYIEDDCFIGMQALIFRAHIGKASVIEAGARVIGVSVPPERYVPAGTLLNMQAHADRLPKIDEYYEFRASNTEVVKLNTELARAYRNI